MTEIAGRYSSTYTHPGGGAADLGVTEDPGYRLSIVHSMENIDDTDAYGAMLIDQVYRGINTTMDFITKEYKTQPLRALNPWSSTQYAATGATFFSPGVIAQLSSNTAGALILSSTAGTPAVITPATLTALYAIIHEGFDINWFYNSRLRKIPLKFRFLPYLDTVIKIFSCT